jgi:hypothetical protein
LSMVVKNWKVVLIMKLGHKEVRLSKLNEPKSEKSIGSHNIDLFKIWGRFEFFQFCQFCSDCSYLFMEDLVIFYCPATYVCLELGYLVSSSCGTPVNNWWVLR